MDLLNTYMRSRGDYSPSLLKRTGTGGVRGSAGLSDEPLYEYLAEDELPHYVFANAGTPEIVVDGEPIDHRFGNYATLFVATSERLLCVAGGPDGDTTIEIPYTELEELDVETGRRKLSKQTTLTVESENVELTFHTKDNNAVPAARTFIDERVADAHLERARQKREAGAELREEDATAAEAELAEAADSAARAVEWAPAGSTTMTDGLDLAEAIEDEPIEPPETDDDPDRGAESDVDSRTTLETPEPLTRAGDYDHIPDQGSVSGAVDALEESRVEPLDVEPSEPSPDTNRNVDTPNAAPTDATTPASDLADPSGTMAGESTSTPNITAETGDTADTAEPVSETEASVNAESIPDQYRRPYEAVRDAYHAHEQFERAKIAGDVEEAKAHLQDARDAYETYLDELAITPIDGNVDDLPGDSRALPPATEIERKLTELPEIPPRDSVENGPVAGVAPSEESTEPVTFDTEPEPEPTADVADDATDTAEADVEPESEPEPELESESESAESESGGSSGLYEESSQLAEVREELAAIHEEKGDVLEETDLVDSDVTVADCIEAYGSWTEAVEAAGCEPRPRLLGELQRVTLGLGEIPTREQMNAHGRYDATLYDRYFDSWEDAKDELEAWAPETEDPEPNPEPQSLEGRLTDALRELHAEKGRVPTRSDVMNDCPHSILRFNREFGSLDDALDAAGITDEPAE